MKALEKTLAIIAFLILVSQTVRHAYMLWLEPRGSVLDKYDQPVKNEITNASSLDELVRRYDAAYKKAEEARAQQSNANEGFDYRLQQKEPYKSERLLRDAITDWERRAKEIREVRFYWAVGLALFLLGILSYKKLNRWLGLTLLITGFSEIIYWTSPTFFGPTREFDRLLGNKLVLSVISLVLLLVVIWLNRIFAEQRQTPAS